MMRPLSEMQAEVLDSVPLLDEVDVGFVDAIGAVLSQDVNAPEDLPGFENAAMDGFAVIAADTTNPPRNLRVVDDVAAGAVPSVALTPGTVARIMTGAPIPEGADAVVPVEVTEGSQAESVRIMEVAAVGDHIRPAGGNVRAGTRVFDAG
ncbi:MAG: molybdopterin molybdenumtransferase MoeA, partial [Actinomycetota bacterium]|nr:molybdopterin molybdenumtransferase MoeA [Actinomycetota bacterium]